jgi:hypothetical protein
LGSSKWAPAPRSTPAHFEQKQKELKKQGSSKPSTGFSGSSSSKNSFYKSGKSSLLDANVAVKSTPAAFEARGREMTAKEREAKKIARQQAARVNLTIRALELGKLRNQDAKAKPNMTANHFVPTESPMKSKQLERDTHAWNQPSKSSFTPMPVVRETPKQREPSIASNGWGSMAESKDEEEEEEPSYEPPIVELPEVEEALENGDDDALNNAVVSNFLESTGRNAGESVRLLEEYKGREDELMENLLAEEQHKLDEELAASARVEQRKSTRGYVTAARPRSESGESEHSGWDE